MKKSKCILLFTALLMSGLSFVGCEDDIPNDGNGDDSQKISVESVVWKSDLKDGKEVVLGDNSLNVANRMDIYPTTASNQQQSFTSSNQSVATITAQGQVTTVALGSTTITVTVDEKSADFVLTVVPEPEKPTIHVTSINIPNKDVSVAEGSSKSLATLFTVLPADAADKSVSYASTATDIVTVSAEGLISGVKEGTATITVTSNDNNAISAQFDITVTPYTFYGDYARTTWTMSIAPIPEVGDKSSNITHPLDGNNSTFFSIIKPGKDWEGAVNPPLKDGGYIHFIIDMKEAKTVNYFRIRHKDNKNLQLRFKKFNQILGSNDGTTFTLIGSNIAVTDSGVANVVESPNISFTEANYRYIKFYANTEDCYDPTNGYTVQLVEIYMGRADNK